jgi:hypothetical protein
MNEKESVDSDVMLDFCFMIGLSCVFQVGIQKAGPPA